MVNVIKPNMNIRDTTLVGIHEFSCHHQVPVYDVLTFHALNQILGLVKFNNRQFGNVYYRGECRLHDSLIPSLMRRGNNPNTLSKMLMDVINKVLNDNHLPNTLNLTTNNAKHIVEGTLQHYGIPTRNIDLVDNHWIALWMGLFKCEKYKSLLSYYHYVKREIPLVDNLEGKDLSSEDMYQYILLVAIPYGHSANQDGVWHSKEFVEIDLRQALPSFFIRPHAQHGIVVKRKVEKCINSSDYDLAAQVCAIFRMRIDRVSKWIGTGDMLTQDNLFPSAAYDGGYDRLLQRNDIFHTRHFEITRYF